MLSNYLSKIQICLLMIGIIISNPFSYQLRVKDSEAKLKNQSYNIDYL